MTYFSPLSPDPAHADAFLADRGWIAFLEQYQNDIGGADIQLWHDVATDFRQMRGDRLQAAFWITRQPECDKATAWHFIAGLISWEILESELIDTDAATFDSITAEFIGLLHRWNTGAYRHHSLPLDLSQGMGLHGFDSVALYRQLKRLEDRFLIKLPRMHAFDMDLSVPVSSMARSAPGQFRFGSDTGLTACQSTDAPMLPICA